MRILDRHTTSEFVKSLLASLAAFLFLFLIVDSFSNLDDFIRKEIPLGIIAQYYLTIIPTVVVQATPLACLLAIVYTLGKLNYNNELIAMRSGGLSIYKIIFPIILLGSILSIGIFLLSERVIPKTQEISDTTKNKYRRSYHYRCRR
ncbi:LptF/LptG family permease, partial [Thermoproteota archaeon]